MSEDLHKRKEELMTELFEIEKQIIAERSKGSGTFWNCLDGYSEKKPTENDMGVFGLPESIGGGVGFF